MNIIKQNQIKAKISKLAIHNVFIYNIINKFTVLQNTSIPTRPAFINSAMNKTNNNSVTSLNLNSNLKNKQKEKIGIYNQKMNSIKRNIGLKFSIGNKINLYKKKIFKQNNKRETPLVSLSHNTSQYINYKYLNPNINSNLKEEKFINKTNSNILPNSTNNNHVGNISFNKNNKLQKKKFIDKNKNSLIKPINTNNYIINTFNLSEKNYINNNTRTKTQKSLQRNFTEELKKYRKEKEELKEMNQKHTKLIAKLIEDNNNLRDKINLIQEENTKLKQRIKNYKDNQEQLVMLVKIIQKNGVDIEELIDKWNNEVAEEEEENEEKMEEITSKTYALDSLNDLNEKIDCSSFIPITMKDKKAENKLKVTGVPKLNFEAIKTKQQEKKNLIAKKNNRIKKEEKDNFLNKSK